VVPSASSTPVRTPEPVATVPAPAPATPVVVAELVPAPAPEVVTSPSESEVSAAAPSAATQEQLVAEVETSGSWDAVYAWAQERGWSQGRIDALIRRLEAEVEGERDDDDDDAADLISEPSDDDDKKRRLQVDAADLISEPSDDGDQKRLVLDDTADLSSEHRETEENGRGRDGADHPASDSDTHDEKNSRPSEETGKMSGHDQSGSSSGSKREQSRVPPS
jgi:hypothetical protein